MNQILWTSKRPCSALYEWRCLIWALRTIRAKAGFRLVRFNTVTLKALEEAARSSSCVSNYLRTISL